MRIERTMWSSVDWSTWHAIIPFDDGMTFTYDSTQNLGIKVVFEPQSNNQCDVPYDADAVWDDGAGALYSTWHPGPTSLTSVTVQGRTLVWGIIEADGYPNLTPRTPRLALHGEPSLGHHYLLQLTQAPALPTAFPGGTPVILLTGQVDNVLVGNCRVFVANPSLEYKTAHPMGHAPFVVAVPADPALLFTSWVHQVVTDVGQSGVPWMASNAIRVTLGGKH